MKSSHQRSHNWRLQKILSLLAMKTRVSLGTLLTWLIGASRNDWYLSMGKYQHNWRKSCFTLEFAQMVVFTRAFVYLSNIYHMSLYIMYIFFILDTILMITFTREIFQPKLWSVYECSSTGQELFVSETNISSNFSSIIRWAGILGSHWIVVCIINSLSNILKLIKDRLILNLF